MVSMGVRLLGLLAAAASCVATMHTAPVHSSHAATASNYNGANCPQSLVDGDTPPKTTFWIGPKVPITPFFQARGDPTSPAVSHAIGVRSGRTTGDMRTPRTRGASLRPFTPGRLWRDLRHAGRL